MTNPPYPPHLPSSSAPSPHHIPVSSSPITSQMAMANNEPPPRASIANLLIPHPADHAEKNLLSLSHLAASMSPASPEPRRRRDFSRTKSVPGGHLRRELPDDDRRSRISRAPSVATLGVHHAVNTKRLSRRSSGLSSAAQRAVVAMGGGDGNTSEGDRGGGGSSSHSHHHHAHHTVSPSTTVLRPINANPISGGYASKHTSASNSTDSCAPQQRSIKNEIFQAAAARFGNVEFASSALASMKHQQMDGMEIDDVEGREPSSSSHDAKMHRNRSRTTPDAKRAQNRESAKRFRVAQKKRWADLQETVERKDAEIARLKNMLQDVSNASISKRRVDKVVPQKADVLAMSELELFIKLMVARELKNGPLQDRKILPPFAADIGSLYRVIVAKTDGSVMGVRHQNATLGEAMGGEVGGFLWDHIHASDDAHIRFVVMNAGSSPHEYLKRTHVISYRRRAKMAVGDDPNKPRYLRMKGCAYPLGSESGAVESMLFAEFIET